MNNRAVSSAIIQTHNYTIKKNSNQKKTITFIEEIFLDLLLIKLKELPQK